jgi:putative OPT family oligopeptide transporter
VTQSDPKQPYQPIIPADRIVAEVSWKAVVTGALAAVIFGVANAYLGLKYGMTVAASIPAAVIAMAVLPLLFKKVTVLENNIVQTIASSGESLAAGIVFTVPAFFIWAADKELAAAGLNFIPSKLHIFWFAILGGSLGILLMIPLRKYLVEKEHGKLAFPEGTACAEVIIAGDTGGEKAKLVFSGIGLGALYKILSYTLKLWPESVNHSFTKFMRGGIVGIDATPALLGVGFIIGPRVAAYMLGGAVLGYLAIGPLLSFIGQQAPGIIIPPGTTPLSDMLAGDIRGSYIKYIGVGAVALGGFISLFKAAPVIVHSFSHGFGQLFGKERNVKVARTDKDIPMKWVLFGTLGIILGTWLMPGASMPLIGVACAVLFGFFFVVVAARIVGIVGSSTSPVSGMTIATLLVTCLILLFFGINKTEGMITAMTVGTIVCIAVCMSGDIAQDLKTGYLLGATPWKQQLVEFIGLALPAVVMGAFVFYLSEVFGFTDTGSGRQPLLAPQAHVMSTVVQGIMNSNLPWAPIFVGAMLAASVEILGISALPFAIGLYLPFSLSAPIMIGGLLSWGVTRFAKSPADAKSSTDRGILVASGLVAGDALVGVVVALLMMWGTYATYFDAHEGMGISQSGEWGPWLSLIMFGALCWYLYSRARKKGRG